MEEEQNLLEAEKLELNTKISNWIERGKDFIFPERLEEWKSCVEARANGMYNGRDLDIALEIIEKLNNNFTLYEAKELLESNSQSAGSYTMVSQIVFAFSKQGPEFLEYIMNNNISPETKKAIETKRRENIKLSQISNKDLAEEPNLEEIQKNDEKQENTIEHKPEAENINNEQEMLKNNYLQIRKDSFFTRIVNMIRNFFFSRKNKKDTALDNS